MTNAHATHKPDAVSKQEILLSIITVVRNDAERLSKTINSLLEFYGDERFEHIVIDGESTDQTLDVLRKNSQHKNFRYKSEADKGIYYGMNKGTVLANGRFLLYLNCGDRMASSPELTYTNLSSVPQADDVDIVCFCSRVCHRTHLNVLRPKAGRLHKMPTSHQAMVFSRKFMQRHIYDTRYRIAADFNLYLSADAGRVLVLTNSLPLTDIEAVGVASENPWQSYKEYLQVASEKLHGLTKWTVFARIGCRAVVVIVLKKTLLMACLNILRK